MKNNQKVAVICAYNPRNCGMYSVDLAAKYFLEKNNIKYDLYRVQNKTKNKSGSIEYKELKNVSQLDKYKKIFYWGDFINNPNYGLNDFAQRELDWNRISKIDAYKKWKRLFLLDGYKKKKNVISVSNNFQDLIPHTKKDKNEEFNLKNLYAKKFTLIIPRDSLSLKRLNIFLPNSSKKIKMGMDAALLLNPNQIWPDLKIIKPNKTFAYFFGRSKLSKTWITLLKIWLITGLRPVKIKNWLSMDKKDPEKSYINALSIMQSADFIISDTYHCLINAINLEKKAIGIGIYESKQLGTCGDLKKKILFEDLGIKEFYLESGTDLSSTLPEIIKLVNLPMKKKFLSIKTKKNSFKRFLEKNLFK